MLKVDDKDYCAFTSDDDPENVIFGLISKLEGKAHLVTEVPEQDLEKVLAEYDKYEELMTSEDELDEDGDE